MTDSSGYYGSWGGQTTPTSPYWQNLYDKKSEWGPCYYDVTHVLTGYATYDLPFGRNRKYGNNLNKAVDAAVGGWQVNGIFTTSRRLSANDFSRRCFRHQLARFARQLSRSGHNIRDSQRPDRWISVVRSGRIRTRNAG